MRGAYLTTCHALGFLASYPHVRGAYTANLKELEAFCELSPRAWGVLSDNCTDAVPTVDPTIANCSRPSASAVRWGALSEWCEGAGLVGLIPAHAGSTANVVTPTCCAAAHPRSRGEHVTRVPRRRPRVGLIPAHAGSTCYINAAVQFFAAHPRSRGEHIVSAWNGLVEGGSSPLTRGALLVARRMLWTLRLIPAHAGSTEDRLLRGRRVWAHPRSPGEHDRPVA